MRYRPISSAQPSFVCGPLASDPRCKLKSHARMPFICISNSNKLAHLLKLEQAEAMMAIVHCACFGCRGATDEERATLLALFEPAALLRRQLNFCAPQVPRRPAPDRHECCVPIMPKRQHGHQANNMMPNDRTLLALLVR